LPPLVAGRNWQELAPYDRGEATTFMQSGGRELSSHALDRLFRGLDRIEDAPGMYRLNAGSGQPWPLVGEPPLLAAMADIAVGNAFAE